MGQLSTAALEETEVRLIIQPPADLQFLLDLGGGVGNRLVN